VVSNRGKKLKIICSPVILFTIAVMLLGGASNSPVQADELLRAQAIGILYHFNPDFEAFPRSGAAPLAVRFENWTNGGERPYVKAEWDFNGDGVIDITLTGTDAEVVADVTWTYPLPGVYSVYLTMTDGIPAPLGPLVHTETKLGYITVLFEPWAYDANDNGLIEKEEVVKAIVDYFDGLITKTQVMEVLQLYFS